MLWWDKWQILQGADVRPGAAPTLVAVLERVSGQFSQANQTVQLTNTRVRVTHLTVLLSWMARWLFSSYAFSFPHIGLVRNLLA